MLVDGGNQCLLRSRDEVPDDVAGGGRTGVVVVAPCEIDGTLDATGEIDHVIILQEIKNEVTNYVHNIDYVLQVGGLSLARYNLESHILTVFSEIGKAKYTLTQTRALSFVNASSEKQALRVLNKMDNRQRGNMRAEIKTCIRRHDGVPLHLLVNFVPTTKEGDFTEYFGLIRDISDIKAVEEKLAQESVRAQEVETIKNAFLHNMSHEIRTPLNPVVGFSELS